jgi:hypothetical protein
MKKSDLKSGMLVITRHGERGLVMLNTPDGDEIVSDCEETEKCWAPLGLFNEDLTCGDNEDPGDIVEIWSYPYRHCAASLVFTERVLLWKRGE